MRIFHDWRDLPPDHLIYSAHFNGKQWPSKPRVMGLSNGARELMLLIPAGDPARYWQIKNFSGRQTEPLAELATNIYLYALDKSELQGRYKGQTYLVRRNDKVPAAARPQLAQARAAHPVLDKMVTMREELRQMWLNTSQSREQLAADLQAWCRRAEESGIVALQQFSMKLRAAHA